MAVSQKSSIDGTTYSGNVLNVQPCIVPFTRSAPYRVQTLIELQPERLNAQLGTRCRSPLAQLWSLEFY